MRETVFFFFIFLSILTGNAATLKVKDIDADFSRFSYTNYEVLRKIHEEAVIDNKTIDYTGIDTIKLDIPKSATPIPIPRSIDFKNVTIIVRNQAKDITLFENSNKIYPIDIPSHKENKFNFPNVKEFIDKKILLIITDQNDWVKSRASYGHPHIRKDILLLKDGYSENQPIQPYNNTHSSPSYSYCDVTNDSTRIVNLNFQRTEDSSFKTFLIRLQNTNDIALSCISVNTPESTMYGDAIITLNNCTKVCLKGIMINGTYSQQQLYGYGIVMNNIYNCHIEDMYGVGEWGVFGTNNVNQVFIQDSYINRFDIHCYGKDVRCRNTMFRNRYNQFSSFYGLLSFEECIFDNFVPVTIDGSYSAYTSFDVVFSNCQINVDPKRPFIFNMTHSKFLIDSIRYELRDLEWPNLSVDNLNINWMGKSFTYYIYHTYENTKVELRTAPKIAICNLFSDITDIRYSNSEIISR